MNSKLISSSVSNVQVLRWVWNNIVVTLDLRSIRIWCTHTMRRRDSSQCAMSQNCSQRPRSIHLLYSTPWTTWILSSHSNSSHCPILGTVSVLQTSVWYTLIKTAGDDYSANNGHSAKLWRSQCSFQSSQEWWFCGRECRCIMCKSII
jgi:hypothetical protein